MKKIFTLIATALFAVAANAQVAFLSPEGKEYNDGETMIIEAKADTWGDMSCESPKLKNNDATAHQVKFYLDFQRLPEGTSVSDCFYKNCRPTYESHFSEQREIKANETINTAIEWTPFCATTLSDAVDYATVAYTLYVDGAVAKTVTVHFTNGVSPNGIAEVSANASKAVASYTVNGLKANGNAKGINIVRMNNGAVRKVVK